MSRGIPVGGDRLNGSLPVAERDPLRRAAALRWLLARRDDPDARVHEVLEFDAAGRVLAQLEHFCPGLREYVDHAQRVAALAANLQAAEPVGVPAAMAEKYRQSLNRELVELHRHKTEIQAEDVDRVLTAYVQLADAAGILGFDRG